MKVIVDINNKTLRMLENERSIFKGEYGADKLTLLINKTLSSEYPVITGLLSNGRRIGPFTTDDSYGTERVDGVNYTTANFTLSKENGFTLSEGTTQVTIWIYKTKDSEVVSKTAIGNVTFSVVNTTAFNDGDVIISGNVEGTVVNLKVEIENIQSFVNNQIETMNKSKVTQYTQSYMQTDIDEEELRKRVIYDIFTLSFPTRSIIAGGRFICYIYFVGGPNGYVRMFDTKTQTYFETPIIDSSTLTKWQDVTYTSTSDTKKIDADISTRNTLQELYDTYGSCFTAKVSFSSTYTLFMFHKTTTGTNLTVFNKYGIKSYDNVNMTLNVASLLTDSTGNPTYKNTYSDEKIDELIADLKSSKVSIYTPIYSTSEGDKEEIRKRLTYDILTQSFNSSVIIAGKKYIAIHDIKGGPHEQVKLFDFISNAYYETPVIDTSKLTDYNTISFSTKSYYDKSEIDNLTSRTRLISKIGEATESLSGVMSSEDKKQLNTLVALLEENNDQVVNTISEVLSIFNKYPEGANLVNVLANKVDRYAPVYLISNNTLTEEDVQKLMYLTLTYSSGVPTSSFFIAGKDFLVKRHNYGGPYNQVWVYDFINNKLYYTPNIDTSTLSDSTQVSYSVKSYYTSNEIDELLKNIGSGTGGVSEEDVLNIINKNAEQTETLEIGTSETFDPTSDEQVPTSKAVSDFVASAGGGKLYRHFITIDDTSTRKGTLTIYTNDETPFTKSTFIEYLTSKGITDDDKGIDYASIKLEGNEITQYYSLYAFGGSSLRVAMKTWTLSLSEENVITATITGFPSGFPVSFTSDTVTEL